MDTEDEHGRFRGEVILLGNGVLLWLEVADFSKVLEAPNSFYVLFVPDLIRIPRLSIWKLGCATQIDIEWLLSDLPSILGSRLQNKEDQF
jgi:hypothetical protein